MATRITTELAESLVQYAATGRVTAEIAEALVTFPLPVSPTMGQTFTDKLFLGSATTKPAISSVVGVPVVAGNAGDLALSDNGTLYVYDGAAWVATQDALPALTDGQLFIGSTGLAPVAASLTGGGGISATGSAGSIVLGSSAGGDLSGSLDSATVVAIQGTAVSAAAPALNQVLKYDGTEWAPAADAAATPAAPLNSVQYNSAGAFAGSANLTFDGSTLALDGVGSLLTAKLDVDITPFLTVDAATYSANLTVGTDLTTLSPTDISVSDGNQSANLSAGSVGVTDTASTNTLNLTIAGGLATITSADGVAAPQALNLAIDELQINTDPGTSGYVLTSNGSGAAPTWQAAAASGIDQLTGDVTAGPGSGSQVATLSTQGINTANNLGLTDLPATAPTANQLRDIPAFRLSGSFGGNAFTLLAPTGAQDGRQVTFVNATGGPLTINNIGSLSSRTMSASGGSTWVYSATDVNWFCTSNV